MYSKTLVVKPRELPRVNFEELLEECDPVAKEQRRGSIWRNGLLLGNPEDFFTTRDIGEVLEEYRSK